MGLLRQLEQKISLWLGSTVEPLGHPQCDFERLAAEVRPADVILVEGRTRVSKVIKTITQSAWTHSALYIGRLHDLPEGNIKSLVYNNFSGDEYEPLMIEALIGEGTLINPLSKYRHENLRLCRPRGLSAQDAWHVVDYAVQHLGKEYDMQQLLDLGRLMLPYGFIPRRWRSSLFAHHAGIPTRTVCSSMIAEAYGRVHFPILPVIRLAQDGKMRLYKRNSRLYTPRDFDHSPYFDILKFPPMVNGEDVPYRQLPWDQNGTVCNDSNDCFLPADPLATEGVNPVGPETLDHRGKNYGNG